MIPAALAPLLPVCLAVVVACWLLSVVTREYSWVDRIWSVMPPVYVAIATWQTGFQPRLVLMTALTAAWGVRLTFNFWRKGGYAAGGEDYRWEILRERLGPLGFQVFNATFIAPYQNLLLLLIAAPAAWAAAHPAPLGPADLVLAALFVALLASETVADEQQWRFHRRKAALRERGEPIERPFLDEGLFAWSRHPNYACEIGQWWVVWGFGVAASGVWLDWTLAGPVLLTLLFDGSTRFTEAITLSKYPSYAVYQRTTGRWIPRPWSRSASAVQRGQS